MFSLTSNIWSAFALFSSFHVFSTFHLLSSFSPSAGQQCVSSFICCRFHHQFVSDDIFFHTSNLVFTNKTFLISSWEFDKSQTRLLVGRQWEKSLVIKIFCISLFSLVIIFKIKKCDFLLSNILFTNLMRCSHSRFKSVILYPFSHHCRDFQTWFEWDKLYEPFFN